MRCMHNVGLVAGALLMVVAGSAVAQMAPTDLAIVTGGVIKPDVLYKIGLHIKIKVVRSSGSEFVALAGPLPGAAPGAWTDFIAEPIQNQIGPLKKTALLIKNQDGFVYMMGIQPYGGTDGGTATSDGTCIIVQQITIGGTKYYRWFRLEGPEHVEVKDEAGNTRDILFNNQYVEREEGESLGDPQNIPASGDLRDFIDAVIQMAQDAGLPTP